MARSNRNDDVANLDVVERFETYEDYLGRLYSRKEMGIISYLLFIRFSVNIQRYGLSWRRRNGSATGRARVPWSWRYDPQRGFLAFSVILA
jgi:hypothetical protein